MKYSQSAHKRIANDLRALIMEGTLVGQLRRSEDLAKDYGVVPSTVTSALNELKLEGLVESTRGQKAARFAVDWPARIVGADPYIETTDQWQYGKPEIAEVAPPGDVARELGVDQAIRRRRLTLFENEPIELSESYMPVELARELGLDKPRKPRGGLKAVFAAAGLPQRRFVDVVSARLPKIEEVEALNLPPEVPILRILRTIKTDGDRVICVDVIIKGAHLYHERYESTVE